ncbi:MULTISPECIES: hypothetical protein [Arthrobacter]|uniref:hypothetical protein n=1 Tax=Arthrobacter TaxID=1663 RepID=UPI000B1BDBC1|nr:MULTISPECIES: hypothetical protein [Arthrobacter]
MRLDGIGFFVILVVWLIVPAITGFILYWIVRLGVKHGLRSYYTDSPGRPPSTE